MELYKYDYILVDKSNDDVVYYKDIYYFSSIIEMFNDGFKLKEGEEFVCMTDLPFEVQSQYIKTFSYE